MLPEQLHEWVEHEIAVAEQLAYQRGVEDARRAMAAGIEEAIDGAPGSAKAVVRSLVAWMERSSRPARVVERVEHFGGPVEWDGRVAA